MTIYNQKFIADGTQHPFIPPFSKYLDIKFSKDNRELMNSERSFLGWNWWGGVDGKNEKIFNYRKTNDLPFFCMERGALPGSLIFDPDGFNYQSRSYDRDNWDKDLTEEELIKTKEYIENFKISDDSLEQQKAGIAKTNPFKNIIQINKKFNKIIFIPLQLHDDTVIKNFAGWTKSLKNFISNILELSRLNKNILFVYKNHPLGKYLSIQTENLFCADNIHFKDCLKYSDAIITINSGVGLQAMIYSKPVFLCGNAFYEFPEINVKTKNLEDLSTKINGNHKPNEKLILRFLTWLRNSFYSDVDWYSIPNQNASILRGINRVNIWTKKKTYVYK